MRSTTLVMWNLSVTLERNQTQVYWAFSINKYKWSGSMEAIRNTPVKDAPCSLLFSPRDLRVCCCLLNGTLGKQWPNTDHSAIYQLPCSASNFCYHWGVMFWYLQQTWGRAVFSSYSEKLREGPVVRVTERYFLSAFPWLDEHCFLFHCSPVHMGKTEDMLFLEAVCIWPLSQEGRWKQTKILCWSILAGYNYRQEVGCTVITSRFWF